MKGGRPTKLTVKRFNRIKHFWDNTGLTLANNSFWYLYEYNLLRARLNTNVNEISNYETLERLIKERGNLNDNTTELPENMHLEFEIENDDEYFFLYFGYTFYKSRSFVILFIKVGLLLYFL